MIHTHEAAHVIAAAATRRLEVIYATVELEGKFAGHTWVSVSATPMLRDHIAEAAWLLAGELAEVYFDGVPHSDARQAAAHDREELRPHVRAVADGLNLSEEEAERWLRGYARRVVLENVAAIQTLAGVLVRESTLKGARLKAFVRELRVVDVPPGCRGCETCGGCLVCDARPGGHPCDAARLAAKREFEDEYAAYLAQKEASL